MPCQQNQPPEEQGWAEISARINAALDIVEQQPEPPPPEVYPALIF